MGDIDKSLLKLIGFLIPNTRVATLVIVIVKIAGAAGLGIGQVSEDGSVPGFEFLSFEARLQAFG